MLKRWIRSRQALLADLDEACALGDIALDMRDVAIEERNHARDQMEKMRAERDAAVVLQNADAVVAQLKQAEQERDDAVGKCAYTQRLLEAVRESLTEAYREREQAQRERDEARKDLVGQVYRWGDGPQQTLRSQLLRETARADELAELVGRLQVANMANDRAPARPTRW